MVGSAETPEEFLAANAALRDAILGRYALEMRLIGEIQAALANLLQNVVGPALDNLTRAALLLSSLNDVSGIQTLYEEPREHGAHWRDGWPSGSSRSRPASS